MNNETQDGQENLPQEPVQEVTPANPVAEGAEAPAPKVRKPRAPKAEATGEEPPKRVRKPKAAVVAAEAEAEAVAVSAELPVTEAAETLAPAEAVIDATATPTTHATSQDAPVGEDGAAPTERRARPKRGARSDDGEARPNRGKLVPISDEPVEGLAFDDVIAGALDVEESPDAPGFPKRVLPPQPEQPKLHKVLAQAGLGSRLEMERLIAEGRISVNDEAAHVGQRIQWGDKLRVNGKLLRLSISPPRPRVLAYHKPAGEVVTHDDPQNRPTVFRKMPRLQQGKWQSVGRLDLNTEGLLLFTNSGELANRLMHPSFGLEREYAVRVLGALSNDEKDKLLGGVQLDDGMAQFGSIEEGGGEGANHWYKVTISEGRNREVRRMIESVGHAVSRLIRIRYGVMQLPRGLRRGFYMELGDRDIQALAAAVGLDLQQAAPQQGHQGQPRDDRKDQARNRGLRRPTEPNDGYRPQQQDQGYAADDYDEDFAPEQGAQNAGEQPAPGFAPAPRSNDNKTRRTPFGRKRGPGGDERAAPRARTDGFAPRDERQAPRARPDGYPPRDERQQAPRGRPAPYGQRDDRQMPRGRPDGRSAGYPPRDDAFNARDSDDDFSQRGVSHESPFDQKSSRKRIFSNNNEVPSIVRASRSGGGGGGAYAGPARGAGPSRGRSQGGDGDSEMPKGIDPMKTRFGFIGGDSFNNAKRSGGNGRGRSQGGSGGGGARSGGGGRSGGGQSRGFGGKR